jgi:hypothetical protein
VRRVENLLLLLVKVTAVVVSRLFLLMATLLEMEEILLLKADHLRRASPSVVWLALRLLLQVDLVKLLEFKVDLLSLCPLVISFVLVVLVVPQREVF